MDTLNPAQILKDLSSLTKAAPDMLNMLGMSDASDAVVQVYRH